MLIKSIKLRNFLSFGETSEAVSLGPLNIIIGSNGSGKSNFLEAMELLRNAPDQLLKRICEGGRVRDWLWKGNEETPTASLDIVVGNPEGPRDLRYILSFTETSQRFDMLDERVESEEPDQGQDAPHLYYRLDRRVPSLDFEKSILAQRKDADHDPEVTYLGNMFGKIRLYREWNFGRGTAPRVPQKADLPNDALEVDSSNLGLVLKRLHRKRTARERLLEALRELYEGIDDYNVQIEGGTVQIFFQEGNFVIPATRLSDGTLRYLCLLAVLCDPHPPPLVCIEEPELGLHPDVLPTLAELMIEASERTQLIVTTHSDILVDAMTDQPEVVLVCEKRREGSVLTRLNADKLAPWLEDYRLGELWTRGDIGGTRW